MFQKVGIRVRHIAFFLIAAALFTLVPASFTYAERPYKRCEPGEVHPIWWKATITQDINVRIQETGQKTSLDAGTKVTVVSYNRTGPKEIMLKDGSHCTVSENAVSVYEDACTPGDYAKATKLSFVNSRRITSETDYMIWVSTDMQSLNVFMGSNRNWRLVKSFKCSSGMAGYETPIGSRSITAIMRVCHSNQWDSNLEFFLSFGGSGIHKWPGPHMGENIGIRPCSHACVRLSRTNAIWAYEHIPVGTRLLIY